MSVEKLRARVAALEGQRDALDGLVREIRKALGVGEGESVVDVAESVGRKEKEWEAKLAMMSDRCEDAKRAYFQACQAAREPTAECARLEKENDALMRALHVLTAERS